jgi:hypothetical protein
VETGLPAVPCDAARRIETLSRNASPKSGGRSGARGGERPGERPGGRPGETGSASKWPRCFIIAPVLFNGANLGLLAVHDMKGVGKILARDTAERIRQASRALVPALLYGKLHGTSPFGVARELVAGQMDEAKKSGRQLAVASFTLENAKQACGELGFDKYWGIVERLRRLLESAAGERGVVKEADWNRLFLFLRERGDNEVDELIARVRTAFSGGFKKSERESGIALATLITRYPRDSKSVEDILLSVT